MANIFILDECPKKAARMHCDKHVRSQVKEAVQILIQALINGGADINNGKAPTKADGTPHRGFYPNHPCVKWAQESFSNWCWLLNLARELCNEYLRRFGKEHASKRQLAQMGGWVAWTEHIPEVPRTPFARALNQSKGRNLDLLDESISAVDAYREFYRREKAGFAQWPEGKTPDWWGEATMPDPTPAQNPDIERLAELLVWWLER